MLNSKYSISHLTCVPSVGESTSPTSSALSLLWVHLREGGHQGFLCQAEWVLLVNVNAKNTGQTRPLLEEQVARRAPFTHLIEKVSFESLLAHLALVWKVQGGINEMLWEPVMTTKTAMVVD